ncbi:MAG: DUF4340 domain-containing protein, partial [Planctomycetota bacterium]
MIINSRQLGTLAIVAALLLILTIAVYSGGRADRGGFSRGQLLIQGLDPDRVHTIRIRSGEEAVTLVRKTEDGVATDQFVLRERNDYPASIEKVNRLLVQSLDIRCADLATRDADRHDALGVADEAADATEVRFLGEDDQELTGFVVGASAGEGRGAGVYVRRIHEGAVYITENMLNVGAAPADYIDSVLVPATAADIQRVEVTRDETTYAIARGEDDKPVLQDIPEGKRAKDYPVRSTLEALARVRAEDMQPADAVDVEWLGVHAARTGEHLLYRLRVGKTAPPADADAVEDAGQDTPPLETDYYVIAEAQGPDRALVSQVRRMTGEEDDAELARKDAVLTAWTDAQRFNQRTAGWAYRVSEWQGKQLVRPLDELVEPIPEGPEEIAASHILISYAGA